MPRKDALDTLLAALQKDYLSKIADLRKMKESVDRLWGETAQEKLSKLRERINKVREESVDEEDGELINPAIEDAMGWLDNEGAADLEEVVNSLTDVLDTEIERLEGLLTDLGSAIDATPPESFFLHREDEDDYDPDAEEDDDAGGVPPPPG